ncbi:hypothetical protein CCACVL1_02069 [Corchorus capsularis]|uniref:C2H2-type domain-containing protein n=1 Tax=Corchorus capsularis TaxID=210143 RepID=A0A1R3KD55_COCAP|nr:hypothetical protein CCACVL1_02069 [Corchorus capsularis]
MRSPLSQNKKLMIEEKNVEADASMAMSQSESEEVESPISYSKNKGRGSHGRVKKSIIRSAASGYPCETCGKTFPSGQALGGHKRCHRAHKAVDDAINNSHTRLYNRGKKCCCRWRLPWPWPWWRVNIPKETQPQCSCSSSYPRYQYNAVAIQID